MPKIISESVHQGVNEIAGQHGFVVQLKGFQQSRLSIVTKGLVELIYWEPSK